MMNSLKDSPTPSAEDAFPEQHFDVTLADLHKPLPTQAQVKELVGFLHGPERAEEYAKWAAKNPWPTTDVEGPRGEDDQP